MKVQGRVDSLTATQLLKVFQEASPQTDSIELDVEKMPYITGRHVVNHHRKVKPEIALSRR